MPISIVYIPKKERTQNNTWKKHFQMLPLFTGYLIKTYAV